MDNATIGWSASGKDGAVAAGAAEAVSAGIQLLADGGNAADAAVATILAMAVTDYGLFAIGGEVPLIIYNAAEQRVRVLSGIGRAPLDQAAIDWYYANGIPDQGSYLAMPVPGAVHLCVTAMELYGTRSFADAVAPTLALLDRRGPKWYSQLGITLRKMVEAERQATGDREHKLRAARDRFYIGDIADDLEAWYRDTGSFLRKADLEAHLTTVEEPVSVNYRGYVVRKCGAWTQGPVLCQSLRLLEDEDLRGMGHLSVDYIHTVTEAMKLSYADRDTYYGDPAFTDVPITQLLTDEYTAIRRGLLDPAHASQYRCPCDSVRMRALSGDDEPRSNDVRTPISDTTTCVVADRWGNVVAATPSCNLVGNQPDPTTGVTQGNRLRSMNTTQGHPNRIQAGKRPRVTLTPTLITRDGMPVAAISVAGGDLQDQTTLNALLNWLEFGMPPAEAVTAPRFSTDHMENSFDSNPNRDEAFISPGSLQLSSAVAGEVQSQLTERGHRVTTTSDPIAAPVMLSIDPDTGIIHAAGDPAAGKHAAAVDGPPGE